MSMYNFLIRCLLKMNYHLILPYFMLVIKKNRVEFFLQPSRIKKMTKSKMVDIKILKYTSFQYH